MNTEKEKFHDFASNVEDLSVLADGVSGLSFVYWDSVANGSFSMEVEKAYEHAAWAIQRLAEELATKMKQEINEFYVARQKETS